MISKSQGRASSMPRGILQGLFSGCVMMSMLLAVTAALIQKEMIPMERIGYFILVILFATSFIAAKTACRKIQRQKRGVCLLMGMTYYIFLLSLTALLFGGQFSSVIETGGVIAAGSICALLLQKRGEKIAVGGSGKGIRW